MGGYLCWLDCEHTYDFSYFSLKGTGERKKREEKRRVLEGYRCTHERVLHKEWLAKEQKQQFSMSRRKKTLFFLSFLFPRTNEGCRVKKNQKATTRRRRRIQKKNENIQINIYTNGVKGRRRRRRERTVCKI